MKIFDTHAHLGLVNDDPITQLIVAQEARSMGIHAIVNVCNNLQDFPKLYDNLQRASNVYFAVGISPSEVTHTHFKWDNEVEKLASLNRVIAIGETGLDRKCGNKSRQIEFFIRHIEISEKLNYPIIIHNRETGKEVLDVLKEVQPVIPIIFHCYSENWDYAQQVLDTSLNIFFSFTGSVTYRTARLLREVATKLPEESIIIESESPFMIPSTLKGKRNKPSYIHHTLKHIAQLRETDEESFANVLFENSCRAFKLQDLSDTQ